MRLVLTRPAMVAQTRRRAAAAERTEANDCSASSAQLVHPKPGPDISKRLGKPSARAWSESRASSPLSAEASQHRLPTIKRLPQNRGLLSMCRPSRSTTLIFRSSLTSLRLSYLCIQSRTLRRSAEKFNEWFPDLANQDEGQPNASAPLAVNDGSRDSKLERRTGTSPNPSSPPQRTRPPSIPSQRKGKAKKTDCVHSRSSSFLPSFRTWDLYLPRTAKGWVRHRFLQAAQCLCGDRARSSRLHAKRGKTSKKPFFDGSRPRRGTQARQLLTSNPMMTRPCCSDISFQQPSKIQLTSGHLDPILLSKEWIQLYGEVTLVPPFLPQVRGVWPGFIRTIGQGGLVFRSQVISISQDGSLA